jgi:hypothetical protein
MNLVQNDEPILVLVEIQLRVGELGTIRGQFQVEIESIFT